MLRRSSSEYIVLNLEKVVEESGIECTAIHEIISESDVMELTITIGERCQDMPNCFHKESILKLHRLTHGNSCDFFFNKNRQLLVFLTYCS